METLRARLQQALARRGIRRTAPRQEVLEVFQGHHLPMGAAEVHRRLRDRRVNLVSVYRAIHLFCRLGILVEVDHVREGKRYELSDDHRAHHHHLICQGCGTTQDFEACFLQEFERRISRRAKFHITRHELRFFGLCRACAS